MKGLELLTQKFQRWAAHMLLCPLLVFAVSGCDTIVRSLGWDLEHFFAIQYDLDRGDFLHRDPSPMLSEVVHLQTLELRDPDRSPSHPLNCDSLWVADYGDQPAVLSITSEGRVRNLQNWYAPAVVAIDLRQTLNGTLRSASLSVAILGSDFDIDSVIDNERSRFEPMVVERAVLRWPQFATQHRVNLEGKETILSGSQSCEGYEIFFFEIN